MGEIQDDINKKTSIELSRNTPVGLVVGAAGFLGSHLVDKLLSKSIQVVGLDNLSSGKKDHLREASGNKHFHLVIDDAQGSRLDPERLDYIFITSSRLRDFDRILELFKKHKCRLLFTSSIDLYDRESSDPNVVLMRHAESKIAKFAEEHHLNARILRVGAVFGPRMNFKTRDPIVRLIHQALLGHLQKDISMEFSSRALYVEDAVDLMTKAIFSGSTAQKIFDGVLPAPIKVSEIKQILLDPHWYETRDFTISELPPWPTPNLLKTIRILNWHPKTSLVSGLEETLGYFKDVEIDRSKLEEERAEERIEKSDHQAEEWKKRQAKDLASFKKQPEVKRKRAGSKFFNKILLALAIFIITYAIIWPIGVLGWGVLTFRSQLGEAALNLEQGRFSQSLENINQAKFALDEAKGVLETLEPIREFKVFDKEPGLVDEISSLADLSLDSAESTVFGVEALYKSLRAVTGDLNESADTYFTTAKVELTKANQGFSAAAALLESENFKSKIPKQLKPSMSGLGDKLSTYSKLVSNAKALSSILPNLVAQKGSKVYLILLQNNMELRPAGGFIGSFAKVSFEGGKLKTLEAEDIYAIDGQLSLFVEPPKEIAEDLGQNRWFLRDSNWEPDFPTAARQAEWFYNKETGERVEGVIALDISAMQELLSVIGSLELPDYNEIITSQNLFEKAVSHAELSFFPGSQAKKSFLTALIQQVFNKLFFLPNQNWPGIVTALGKSLEEKHMSIYLDDPKLFSYLLAQNWAHSIPRESEQNAKDDFLAMVEANLGANKANYYLDRNIDLETVVGKAGEISHTLRVNYLNRSPSGAFPAGVYKNRMRIYLPFGSKVTKVLWGEADITNKLTSFVDFGRSGYSLLLELEPKEQKVLVLDYSTAINLEFKNGKAIYRLDIVKQAGTGKDPLNWRITFPISYSISSDKLEEVGPQEQVVKTDLSKDRRFEVEFSK